MGLAEQFVSLTFRTNINLHMLRDEFVVKKMNFDEHSAQPIKQSLMIH